MTIRLLFFVLTHALSFTFDVGFYGRTIINRDLIDVSLDENDYIDQLELCFIKNQNIESIMNFNCCEFQSSDKSIGVVYYVHMLHDITGDIIPDDQMTRPSYLSYHKNIHFSTISFISLEYFQNIYIHYLVENNNSNIPEYVRKIISRFVIFVENNPNLDKNILETVPYILDEEFDRFLFYNARDLYTTLYNDLYKLIRYIRSKESLSSDYVAFKIYKSLYKRSFEVYNKIGSCTESTSHFNNGYFISDVLFQIRDLHKFAKLICQPNKKFNEEIGGSKSIFEVLLSLDRCLILEISAAVNFNLKNTKIVIHGDLKRNVMLEPIIDSINLKIIIPCLPIFTCFSYSVKLEFINGTYRSLMDIKDIVNNIKNIDCKNFK